jgi:hypothetical protein
VRRLADLTLNYFFTIGAQIKGFQAHYEICTIRAKCRFHAKAVNTEPCRARLTDEHVIPYRLKFVRPLQKSSHLPLRWLASLRKSNDASVSRWSKSNFLKIRSAGGAGAEGQSLDNLNNG